MEALTDVINTCFLAEDKLNELYHGLSSSLVESVNNVVSSLANKRLFLTRAETWKALNSSKYTAELCAQKRAAACRPWPVALRTRSHYDLALSVAREYVCGALAPPRDCTCLPTGEVKHQGVPRGLLK
mmetsp:Transcript_13431/g.21920  ORF Transcript_13431/g.21920 Transcript_13431/m.21920 type:complete len:128 (+) Transcript_13431:461-844(+)